MTFYSYVLEHLCDSHKLRSIFPQLEFYRVNSSDGLNLSAEISLSKYEVVKLIPQHAYERQCKVEHSYCRQVYRHFIDERCGDEDC